MIRVDTISGNGKVVKSEVCRDGDHATRYIARKRAMLRHGSSVNFTRTKIS